MYLTAKSICKITLVLHFGFANIALANSNAQTASEEQSQEQLVSYLPAMTLSTHNSETNPHLNESRLIPYDAYIPNPENESILLPINQILPSTHHTVIPIVHNKILIRLNPLQITPAYPVTSLTRNNIQSAVTANQEFVHKPINEHWVQQINEFRQQYQSHFQSNAIERMKKYGHYWENNYCLNWYSEWYKWGFYGGYHYPVHSYFAIEDYFTYPAVQMFFVEPSVTPEYFSNYYSANSAPTPKRCLEDFSYKHIYLPTDTLLYILVEVSSFPQNLLCNFREAIINFNTQLQQEISNYYAINFSLHENDIVVNYYLNLQNKAILLVGFVNQNKVNTAFEALLDLENPRHSITFVPKGNKPTDSQLQKLYQLNRRIIELGGDPFNSPQKFLPENSKSNITGFQQFITTPKELSSTP